MKRLFKTMLFCLTFVFLFGSVAIASPTNEPSLLEPVVAKEIRENFTKMGIDKDTQDKLIKKLEKGEKLDSMDPEKREKAKKHLVVTKENPRAEYTFEDGSKIVLESKVLKSEKVITPMSTYIYDTVYVSESEGFGTGSFTADVMYDLDYDADRIQRVYDEDVYIFQGTFNITHFGIDKSQEDYRGDAKASLKFNWTRYLAGNPFDSGLATVILYVGNDTYRTTII